jgi:hypothetical protein
MPLFSKSMLNVHDGGDRDHLRSTSETAREATEITERQKTLVAMLANVAEIGAGRMEETIGKAKLRDAAIGTGIAVDKMLALTGQTPPVQIAVVLPTPEEKAERPARHAALTAIMEQLAALPAPTAP